MSISFTLSLLLLLLLLWLLLLLSLTFQCGLGYAGSDAKVDYLKSLGFDAAYNYKTMSSLKDTLKESCPKGVDMFFDNVNIITKIYYNSTFNFLDFFLV